MPEKFEANTLAEVTKRLEKKESEEHIEKNLDSNIEQSIRKLSEYAISDNPAKVEAFSNAVKEVAEEYGIGESDILDEIYTRLGSDEKKMADNMKFFDMHMEGASNYSKPSALENCAMEIVRNSGFEKIVIVKKGKKENAYFDFGMYFDYDQMLLDMQLEKGKELYNFLDKKWGFERIPLNTFMDILHVPDELKFFMDERNVEKVRYIFEAFDPNNGKDMEESCWEIEDEYYTLIEIFKHYDKFKKYEDDDLFNDLTGRKTDFHELRYFTYTPDLINDPPNLAKIRDLLKDNYGYEPKEIREVLFLFSENSASETVKILSNPHTKELFNFAKNEFSPDMVVYQENYYGKKAPSSYIAFASQMADIPNAIGFLKRMKGFGLELNDIERLKNFYRNLDIWGLSEEVLKGNEFINFYNRFCDKYSINKGQDTTLIEVINLYQKVKDDPEKMKFINSYEFADIYKFIVLHFKDDYDFADVSFDLVFEMADKSKEIAFMVKSLEAEGELVYKNDLALINQIVRRPDLEKLLADRPQMEKIVRDKVLTKVPVRPERELFENKIGAEMIDEEYLSNMPKLELLRACMISEALESEGFKGHLGNLIIKDLNNDKSEVGGEIVIKGNELYLKNLIGRNLDNRSYSPIEAIPLAEGITRFHFHAMPSIDDNSLGNDYWKYENVDYNGLMKDLKEGGYLGKYNQMVRFDENLRNIVQNRVKDSETPEDNEELWMEMLEKNYTFDQSHQAGPSKKDISFSSMYNATGVVFAPTGFIQNEDGTYDRTRLKVNADMYYVDKSDPENHKAKMLDFGEIIVPIEGLE
ncbi:hypothetical protein GF354_06645 [Candidatus Peregrinibacteria bacterium]|nr:hypothetical protein [Candidatus Peregrinibacteria bacterium]